MRCDEISMVGRDEIYNFEQKAAQHLLKYFEDAQIGNFKLWNPLFSQELYKGQKVSNDTKFLLWDRFQIYLRVKQSFGQFFMSVAVFTSTVCACTNILKIIC